MKKFYIFILIGILTTHTVAARDFEIPNLFNPGDTLSASVLNEIFNQIKISKNSITADELVGEWICVGINGYTISSGTAAGWQNGPDNLYSYLDNITISFQSDGDGTYSLSTNSPDPFLSAQSNGVDSPFTVLNNNIYLHFDPYVWTSYIATYSILKISDSRLFFVSFTENFGGETQNLTCDRQDIPPTNPTSLTGSLSNTTVSLSWTDNSDDEDSFKILRRDSLDGSYNEVGTANANATSFNNTLTANGTYWYRVVATNEYGDSLGSNVVKVTLGNSSSTQQLKQELKMLKERIEILEKEVP